MEIKDLPKAYQGQARKKYEKALKNRSDDLKAVTYTVKRFKEKNGSNRRKYGNKKTIVDGHEFDSLKEASRYRTLKAMEEDGEIKNLILQPRYELIPSFSKGGKKFRKTEYVADFQYEKDGEIIVEDTKGYRTDVYKIKRKLFEYRYPDLTIVEI